jgi:chemotaxis protein MotB
MNPRNSRSRVSHERWLVSYADFITLLFAFFVVLYAFAKADQKKQAQVSIAIDTAFHSLGIFPASTRLTARGSSAVSGADHSAIPMIILMREDALSPARVRDDLNQIHRELQQSLSDEITRHTVSVQMRPDGLVISLREAGFFRSGSATPRPETLGTLRQIANSLRHTRYDVRVEGHTDNVPVHNAEFDSNWELSAARATRIARMFLDLHAIAPDRLSAAGYAEFHPVASNETADGRAENRRVDLVVMPRTHFSFAAPEPSQPAGPWRKITDNDSKQQ